MPALPRNPPFSYYLMIALFSVILIVVAGGICINYINMSRDYHEDAERLQNITEKHINTSFRQIDTALKIYDSAYNDQMEEAFVVVMEEYDRSGGDPSRVDLQALKQKIGGMEIYFINSSGVIVYSTEQKDLGLDFSVIYPDFYEYLKGIWYRPGFYPDRVVMEWYNGTLTKYAYMPTADHRYIIELGLTSERFGGERMELRYSDVIDEVRSFNSYLQDVCLWQKQKREVYNASHWAEGEESEILDRVLWEERRNLTFTDPDAGTTTRWLLVDMKDPDYGADKSIVAELTYNDAMIWQGLNRLIAIHLLVGLVAVLIGGVFAHTLSRRLTRPIGEIVQDVNLIARGDLDHRINPTRGQEFEELEGSIDAMVGTLKGTIRQLRASEELFLSLWDSVLDATLILDWDGRVLFANRAAAGLIGLHSAGAAVGHSIFEVLDPESQKLAMQNLSRIQEGQGGIRSEYHIHSFDGQVKCVESLSTRILFRGRHADLVSLRDITKRKRAERDLRQSEERFRALYEDNPSMYFIVDAEGVVVSVNRFGAEQLGYTVEELEGRSVLDVFHPDDREAVRRQLAARLENFGQVASWEFRKVRRDGTVLWVKETARAVRGPNGSHLVLVVCEDITDTKRAEDMIRRLNEELEQRVAARTAELAAANQDLESFSYSVSHDLRAPLRAIDGYTSILLQEHPSLPSARTREYMRKVRENVEQMALLINALLDLSRMGRQELTRQVFPLREVVDQALDNLRAEREDREVEIVIGELPPLYADPAMIRQVFQNLLSNALKFTASRQPARIEVGSFRDESGCAVYFVRDNGIGFDMVYADKIFDVFQQLHSRREYEGSGVGLAIVKRIVDRHGGRIWAESREGEGATFYLRFPDAGGKDAAP